jgi:hypothetical protein
MCWTLKLKDELFAKESVASLYSKILEFQELKESARIVQD